MAHALLWIGGGVFLIFGAIGCGLSGKTPDKHESRADFVLGTGLIVLGALVWRYA